MSAETDYLRSEDKIHGYGFMLDERQLRELAGPAVRFCREFLKEIG